MYSFIPPRPSAAQPRPTVLFLPPECPIPPSEGVAFSFFVPFLSFRFPRCASAAHLPQSKERSFFSSLYSIHSKFPPKQVSPHSLFPSPTPIHFCYSSIYDTSAPHPRTTPLEASLSLKIRPLLFLLVLLFSASFISAQQEQGWFRTGTGIGMEKPRIAVPDFVPRSDEAKSHSALFTSVVRDDLSFSGIVELVSPSFYPTQPLSQPGELRNL